MGARRYARPTVARAIISWRSHVERPSKSGETTATSMSLDSPAVPLANEPYKTTASSRIRARSLRTKSSSLRSSSTWLVTTRRTSSSPRRALVPLPHYTWRRDTGSSPHGPRASLETSYASPSVQHQPDPPVLPGRGSLAAPFPAPSLQLSTASQQPAGKSTPCPARGRLPRGWPRLGCHAPLSSAILRYLLARPHLIGSSFGGSNE